MTGDGLLVQRCELVDGGRDRISEVCGRRGRQRQLAFPPDLMVITGTEELQSGDGGVSVSVVTARSQARSWRKKPVGTIRMPGATNYQLEKSGRPE